MRVTHLQRRVRVAAVEHWCHLCKHPINPGQVYVKITGTIDGKLDTFKYHKKNRDCIWDKSTQIR